MPAFNPAKLLNQALQHYRCGRISEAEKLYCQVLAVQPHNIDALNLLGALFIETGRSDQAVQLLRAALAINPNFPHAQYNLGNAWLELARIDDAIAAYRQCLAMKPNYAPAMVYLGAALTRRGRYDEAVAMLQRAVAVSPELVEAHKYLGDAYAVRLQVDPAIACFNQALRLAQQQSRDSEPVVADTFAALGLALTAKGQVDAAVAALRKVVDVNPGFTIAHDNLIHAMLHHPAISSELLLEENRRWNQRHATPLASAQSLLHNPGDPDRRLRIGYVSADFREHASMFFLMPLFDHHDRNQFEIVCYAEVRNPDKVTEVFRAKADLWRFTAGVSDPRVAQSIQEDRIDILVDLKLHTGDNRLGVFAYKPAPVQASWLGYPGTTGLSAIDYRLTDPYLDPPGEHDDWYTEKSIRLPQTFWCYDPLSPDPAVKPLPALARQHITFGCLNTFFKVNDQVLALWRRVLQALPASRLLLMCPEGDHRPRVLEMLGVDSNRVDFVLKRPREQYLELYHDIDIGLDPFPYNGHTTSLDSFWMGVPVITLVGSTVVSRAGLSELINLGLPELVAYSPDQFVKIVTDLATDLPRLSNLRDTLRPRMQASPLMDGPRFTRHFESALRQMWRTYCGS